jgi:hypothetical protein
MSPDDDDHKLVLSGTAVNAGDRDRDFKELCAQLGLALVNWQEVEAIHYRLFIAILDVPEYPISSIVYFSIESFESRRKMVAKMASYFLSGKWMEKDKSALRAEWQQLDKMLKDANYNRNKLAHYSAEFEIKNLTYNPDGSVILEMTEERLQPHPFNYVSRLQGRTSDNEEHSLGSKEIQRYSESFVELAKRTAKFYLAVLKLREKLKTIFPETPSGPDATEVYNINSQDEETR